MARSQNKISVNNFVGGLVTDYHELNTPQGTTVDEDNTDIDRKGSRKRRKGMEYEQGYTLASTVPSGTLADDYVKCFEWTTVANDGDRNFEVIQIGNQLFFYDLSEDPLSAGQVSTPINLDTFKAPAATDTNTEGVQVAAGKGALFVCGKNIEPFYVEYDPVTNTFSTTQITLQIRDFAQQDESLAIETYPTTITAAQKYDLYNQGWYWDNAPSSFGTYVQVYNRFFAVNGFYPNKSQPWWLMKEIGGTGTEEYHPGNYHLIYSGNTLASLGHYVLNVFSKDRSTASDIGGITTETEDDRPTAVAFASGRVFWGFHNSIYFSPVITDSFANIGHCYQQADPTSENDSALVATDGGVIPIVASGAILSLFAVHNDIMVFSSNGVWKIGGQQPGAGFAADAFAVSKLSDLDAVSSRTVISVEGLPCWWGSNGIYVISSAPQTDFGYQVTNLCDKKIQNFFDAIPSTSKRYASGIYDKVRKTIVWVFADPENETGSRFRYNRVLNFDTILGAFFPYTISDLSSASPYVTDVFAIRNLATSATLVNVTDNALANVTDNSGNQVQVYTYSLTALNFDTGGVKYLTFVPGS